MTRKSERGFASLIALLISLAVLMAILALVSINMVQMTQANNESNAKTGVTSLMSAEAQYLASFPSAGYATGTNLHYLSDCPAPVTQNGKTTVTPTATAACESVSQTYTNGKAAYSYAFNVISTVGPDGVAGTSDDGYLVTSTPQNKALGRLTYCANNQDGLLRGKIEGTTPTTAAACNAFDAISAGTASAPATPQSSTTGYTSGVVTGSGSNSSITFALTGLPAGTYMVNGHVNGLVWYNSTSSPSGFVIGQCILSPGPAGTLPTIDIATFNVTSASYPQYSFGSGSGVGGNTATFAAEFNVTMTGTATLTSSGQVTLSCIYKASIMGSMAQGTGPYSGIITATPVTSSTVN
jgi:hypothetical protein